MKLDFANLYNKVVNFFNKTDKEDDKESKDVARNRLKLVLMQDRSNLSPEIMKRMRGELIELLSKYMELDRELLDLNFEHEDNQMALMLSIPVIRAKDEKEILAILDKEDELKKKIEEVEGELEDAEEEAEEESEEETEDDETDETDADEEDEDDDDDGDEVIEVVEIEEEPDDEESDEEEDSEEEEKSEEDETSDDEEPKKEEKTSKKGKHHK